MVTATVLFRIATLLLILFAAGHTLGFLKFVPPSPEGIAVHDAMFQVHFQVGRSRFSYGKFYQGFGLTISLYLLFSAFLAWHLGTLAATNPQAIGMLGWVFCAVQVVSLVFDWIYFSAPPVIFSALLALCIGWASWQVAAQV